MRSGSFVVQVFVLGLALTTLIDGTGRAAVSADVRARVDSLSSNTSLLFAKADMTDGRVSLKAGPRGAVLSIAGKYNFVTAIGCSIFFDSLLLSDGVDMTLSSGQQVDTWTTRADVRLMMNGDARIVEDNGDRALSLPVKLVRHDNSVVFEGLLREEQAREFTAVNYNVENLFDQVDEARNQAYGDYRISPNTQGNSSNYGEQVLHEGRMKSFTDVKIANVRKVLTAIDPNGPEIAGFEEIESERAARGMFEAMRDLGYVDFFFSSWVEGDEPVAIGTAFLSKFPIVERSMVRVDETVSGNSVEPSRPVLKVTIRVGGTAGRADERLMTVYVNHWKSKSGPESARLVYAEALQQDIRELTARDPRADYLILGDLNSNYNEFVTLQEPANAPSNDTNGQTGINHVLLVQGDETKVAQASFPSIKYDLLYELPRAARKTSFHTGHGWSTLDHMIIGPGMYDSRGVSYIDNSYTVPNSRSPGFSFLFNDRGETKRWQQTRNGARTTHSVGGFSDHLPQFARFLIPDQQSNALIRLSNPGRPDAGDYDPTVRH